MMVPKNAVDASRKAPVRVERSTTAIDLDMQFARFVRTSVVKAIRSGAHSFRDLLLDLPSIYPTEVLAVIDRMPRVPGVDVAVLRQIRADASVRPQRQAGGGSLLPIPHPLDFEWRFSDETCRELLVAASEMTRKGETILLYGTPGLAYAAVSLPVRNRQVVFAGENNAVTRRLRHLNRAMGRPISVTVGEGVRSECASAVLVDPPWYPDYLNSMLQGAVDACRADGVVLASLPPVGIRPGAADERDVLEEFAETLGLDREDLRELAISYETPFFENNALAVVGIYAPAVWRRGDLAVYRRRNILGDNRACRKTHQESWVEVEIDGMRIRIRENPAATAAEGGLQSLVPGDVLASVSRRHPLRAKANVWTSGNRIFQAGDAKIAIEAAQASGDGGMDGMVRSLLRRQEEEHLFVTLVDRLRSIASTEAEERLQFARGGCNQFGRAA